MKKFSVILPTMYKIDYLYDTLSRLSSIPSIDEIILIENDDCLGEKFLNEKIIYVKPYSNLFVNPSWNLGVKMSNNQYICLLSDDIVFDFEFVFDMLSNEDTLDICGVLGLSEESFKDEIKYNNPYVAETSYRGYGFGCCMFMNKENYKFIPDELKILWGNHYLFCKQSKKNYVIKNLRTNLKVKTTSSLNIFDTIKNNDTNTFKGNNYCD